MDRPTLPITTPATLPAARIGTTPRIENGCGPRRVMATKAPRITPVLTVRSRVGRRMMYTTIGVRFGRGGGGRRGGGSGGTMPAPSAVGGHRGGSASRARASVATGISSAAVNATIRDSTLLDGPRQLHALHCPSGGCQSSTLFPSGSMTQPNFPNSESSVFSSTLQPSLRSAWSRPAKFSTR